MHALTVSIENNPNQCMPAENVQDLIQSNALRRSVIGIRSNPMHCAAPVIGSDQIQCTLQPPDWAADHDQPMHCVHLGLSALFTRCVMRVHVRLLSECLFVALQVCLGRSGA